MNVETDSESRYPSEWKIQSTIIRKLCQIRETIEIDLFASRVSHQLIYLVFALENRPLSHGSETFPTAWAHKFVYAFSIFALIEKALQNVNLDQCLMFTIAPAWPGQLWFPVFLKMFGKKTMNCTIAQRSTERFCRKLESTTNTVFTAAIDLHNLGQNLLAEVISERASSLTANNKRISKTKHYQ